MLMIGVLDGVVIYTGESPLRFRDLRPRLPLGEGTEQPVSVLMPHQAHRWQAVHGSETQSRNLPTACPSHLTHMACAVSDREWLN